MTNTTPIMEKTHAWATEYAQRKGYKLNPDQEMVQLVVEGLSRNREELGRQYCPCRIVSGNVEQDRKIICPCTYHHDEIKNNGSCHCSLFFKQ